MKRLEWIDWALLIGLVPIWLFSLGLHVKEIARTGFAEPPIYAAPPLESDGYPRVGGFRLERGRGGESIHVGDTLIQIGDTSLRGVGYFGFDAIALDEAGLGMEAPLIIERGGTRRTIPLEMLSSGFAWYRAIPTTGWVIVSSLILLRGARRRESRLLFAATLCVAIQTTQFYGGPREQSYVALASFWIFGGISFILALRWAIGFPYELSNKDRVPVALCWIGVLFWVVRLGYVFNTPIPPDVVPYLPLSFDAVFVTLMLGIITRNYYYSDPVGRRRVKWILFSGYLGVAPLVPTIAARIAFPDFPHYDLIFEIVVTLWVLVPIGLLIGILKYNLYDIDRLISMAASYSVVGGFILAGALTLLPRVAAAASPMMGLDSGTGQTLLSFGVAMLVVPAHRKLRPQIERFFFRERHAIEQGITSLLSDLSGCTGPGDIFERVGDRLDSLLRPDSTTIYAGIETSASPAGGFEPTFTRGQGVPPAFEGDSLLVSTLQDRKEPLTADAVVRSDSDLELSPFDRAALETLGVPLVLPIRRGDELAAFLCLGPKRSGDVYTSTDVTLLTAVTEKVASELLRFGHADMIEAGREMQASLRRYVPGAIAEQIEAGADLQTGEQEVTVLFVDIRSYTTYSEGRRAEEIFSTVNRFTDTVSRTVRLHGGCVVEFNGDGMMTVFGAPAPLEDKERHAVEAGQAIFLAMEELALSTRDADSPPLSVGVGIATGEAYVGNIQAVDRMIWSAIGNTTNLAARLQQLTRDLDVAIVIDAATWRAAGLRTPPWNAFPDTRIRGRTESIDMYGLRLENEPPAD